MAGDRIEGRDIVRDAWAARKGYELDDDEREAGCVAAIHVYEGSRATTGLFDEIGAARVAAFLLSAAKIDIVGAARKARRLYADPFATEEEQREAMRALASELAKLDAMVGHDMSEVRQEK